MASNLDESKSLEKEPVKKQISKTKRNSAVRDANNSIQTNKTYSVNQEDKTQSSVHDFDIIEKIGKFFS